MLRANKGSEASGWPPPPAGYRGYSEGTQRVLSDREQETPVSIYYDILIRISLIRSAPHRRSHRKSECHPGNHVGGGSGMRKGRALARSTRIQGYTCRIPQAEPRDKRVSPRKPRRRRVGDKVTAKRGNIVVGS